MKRARRPFAAAVTALGVGCHGAPLISAGDPPAASIEKALPAPRDTGAMPLETAIARRRSHRELAPSPLGTQEIGQLAWAAQGITDPDRGLRAAPSAGALYPLELYVVDAEAVWHYRPARHALERVAGGDRRAALARAAYGQPQVGSAPVALVLTGIVARTRAKYADRAERYVDLEAGHAAENVLLEATALGLWAVPVGAFDDDEVRRVLGVAAGETPLYILCVGRPGTTSHAQR